MFDKPSETTDRDSEQRNLLSELSFMAPDGEEISFSSEDIAIITKHLSAFRQIPANFVNKIPGRFNENTKNLDISSSDWKKAILRQPTLFDYLPNTINSNVEKAAEVMDIAKRDYVKSALRQPSLFYQSYETVNSNVVAAAWLIGMEKSDYTKVVLRQPSLFTMKPRTILCNFESLRSFIFNNDKQKTVEAILKLPSLLTASQEKNFVHYLAREITKSKTKLLDNPVKEIERKFENREIPKKRRSEQGMTEEGLEILKSAIEKAVEDLRQERKMKK